ncbi:MULTISPECIES: AAA-like domain-containing protein [unclassified Synechocystis]|uniref:AAA-like domain-containing protein n=1 Tax=unclassified Synechocystis TaxID=2640012 RepID=UPI0003F8227E|nr:MULTISPECIES: AAA-like domain-containing protein [unclassified Synechocystis]AIE73897.1 High-affnity carbon uptake protein Hat/HatR [Synechocystis sp. PCC 6714]MCT0252472.1 AAA-like domain-containing protein [Synechocystis sp. CS-94]
MSPIYLNLLQSTSYQVGGSLAANHPSYSQREADKELLAQLRGGKFCYVFNCRQMGKSSLRVRTMHQLQQDGVVCVSIDITSLGTEADPQKWYNGIITQLYLGLPLAGKVALKPWLREREQLSPIQKLREFVEAVILQTIGDRQIVIFIDEIDKVLSLPFSLDDFFSYIRFCYNQRADDREYNRLSFALFGVATPSDLIDNKTQTPFNIGQAIALTGFTLTEALPLSAGLPVDEVSAQEILREILVWTGGQPFLTQKVCELVAEALQEGDLDFQAQTIPTTIAQLIEEKIIRHWESNDEPVHFRTIGDRLLKDEARSGQLLGLYQEILHRGFIPADDSVEQTVLRLTGLVVKIEGQLRPYNPIYQAIFNAQWVSKELNKLRPYGTNLQAWINSDYQDSSRLLRGEALREALAWASSKNLSGVDYRYLNASQNQEQEASLAANQILTQANVKAKRMISFGIVVLMMSLGGSAIALSQAYFATLKQQRSQQGTELQRLGTSAQRQFTFDQIPGLVTALEAGHQLYHLVKADETLSQYPATSPLVSLQKILSQIAEKNILTGHRDGVTSVAISPHKNLIASASRDGAVRLWTPQGEFLREFTGHTGSLYRVAFAPNGKIFATAGQDQTVKIWDLDGNLLQTLRGHQDSVYSVSFSPDGETLVSTSRDRTVRLWHWRSGKTLTVLAGHTKSVDDAQFSPDGQTLVSVCRDGQIRLWNLQGNLIRQFGLPDVAFFGVSWHPQGNLLAVAGDDGTVRLWNTQGEIKATLSGHDEFVTRVVFSPDGKHLFSSSSNGSVIHWSSGGKMLKKYQSYPEAIFGLDLARNGTLLAIGAENNLVKLWDMTPKPDLISLNLPGMLGAVAENANTNTIALAMENEPLILFNTENQSRQVLSDTRQNFDRLQFNADGQWLLGQRGREWQLWRRQAELKQVKVWRTDIGRVYDVALRTSPQSPQLAIAMASGSGEIWLWQGEYNEYKNGDRVDGVELEDPMALALGNNVQRKEPIRSTSIHPTLPQLAAGDEQGNLTLWNFDGSLIKSIVAHGDRLNQLQYSPNGKYLLSAGREGTAKIWTVDGELLHTLRSDPLPIDQIAISPDSQWIATAASDGMVRLWDQRGNLRGEFTSASSSLLGLGFNEEGQWLLAVGQNGDLQSWPVTPEKERLRQLVEQGCNWLKDYLATESQPDQSYSPEFCHGDW